MVRIRNHEDLDMKITNRRRSEIRKNLWKWCFICIIFLILIIIFFSFESGYFRSYLMDLIMMFVGFCAFVLWIIHGVK